MKTTRLILASLGAAALAVAAQAITVKLDTSSLAGGTYFVDFQLNDGTGAGNSNNTAILSDFQFGAGGLAYGDDINLFGGASGSLFSSVTLTDTAAFNDFLQSFKAGSFLSFELSLTNNYNAPAPDSFSFALLDENWFNLGTYSLGTDQFVTVDLTGSTLEYKSFAGVDGIAAPKVPEAGSTMLLVSAALVGLGYARRHTRAMHAA